MLLIQSFPPMMEGSGGGGSSEVWQQTGIITMQSARTVVCRPVARILHKKGQSRTPRWCKHGFQGRGTNGIYQTCKFLLLISRFKCLSTLRNSGKHLGILHLISFIRLNLVLRLLLQFKV